MHVRIRLIFQAILIVALACLAPRDDARADAGVVIGPSASQQVTGPDGVCKLITNNNGSNSVFVATATVGEWQSWYSYPNGSTVAACPPVCGGVNYAGYCWYLGNFGNSCDTACSGHGGCNVNGTVNYVGSGGSAGNCVAVINQFGLGGNVSNWNWQGIGCDVLFNAGAIYWDMVPTSCSAPDDYAGKRMCACNN